MVSIGLRHIERDPPLNGNVPFRQWSVRNMVGDVLYPGGPNSEDDHMSPLDYFILMFPPKQLSAIVRLTNAELHLRDLQATTTGEILKWFGIIILMTKFEFGKRASLWSTDCTDKVSPSSSIWIDWNEPETDLMICFVHCSGATNRLFDPMMCRLSSIVGC
jgi:hypothetical protein